MFDEDTFIHMNGKLVRRSDFVAESFDFNLAPGERGQLPADILKAAMLPLRELVEQPDGWRKIVETYDGYSLLSYLMEREVSEPALQMMGPLLDLEGRAHFSLVEWFAHYHEDVFGDLVFIDDGRGFVAERVRAAADE